MPKTDARVDAYIRKAAPFARPILTRLRAAVHEACPDAEETIKWGMPFFLRNGRILSMMAAFKGHASFGFWRAGKHAVPDAQSKWSQGMGQLGRLERLEDLPPQATLKGWIRKAAELESAASKGRGNEREREVRKVTRRHA